jgi:hypothetical protein
MCCWFKWRRRHRRKIWLTIGNLTLRFPKGLTMASLQLTDVQHDALSLSATDAAGNPTTLPAGSVTWGASDPTILAVTPAADGMSADVAAQGPLGTAQVTVAVALDANTTLTGTLDVTVVASAAASIQIVPGTPQNK